MQKTAYELRISDWSSDVCSSDLHIVYSAIDAGHPATMSPLVIGDIIRRRIGFDGVLISDDLNMKALKGRPAETGTAALAAGCDLARHCPGDQIGNASCRERVCQDV